MSYSSWTRFCHRFKADGIIEARVKGKGSILVAMTTVTIATSLHTWVLAAVAVGCILDTRVVSVILLEVMSVILMEVMSVILMEAMLVPCVTLRETGLEHNDVPARHIIIECNTILYSSDSRWYYGLPSLFGHWLL